VSGTAGPSGSLMFVANCKSISPSSSSKPGTVAEDAEED
jgi:hypothetical protein